MAARVTFWGTPRALPVNVCPSREVLLAIAHATRASVRVHELL